MLKQFTALIEREGDGDVSLCPELDIASRGDTIEEGRANLREALEHYFETATTAKIQTRIHAKARLSLKQRWGQDLKNRSPAMESGLEK